MNISGRSLLGSCLVVCLALPSAVQGGTITFEELPNLPAVSNFRDFVDANEDEEIGSLLYEGIVWGSASLNFQVVGDEYVEQYDNNGGSNPWITPHSGHYGLFNSSGRDQLPLVTNLLIGGAWFSRPDFGNGIGGTTEVTMHAFNGETLLSSVTLNLVATGGTPAFMDTSAFASHSGTITSYRIDRVRTGNGPFNGQHYILNNLVVTTTAVPEPSSLALLGIGAVGLFGYARRRKQKSAA